MHAKNFKVTPQKINSYQANSIYRVKFGRKLKSFKATNKNLHSFVCILRLGCNYKIHFKYSQISPYVFNTLWWQSLVKSSLVLHYKFEPTSFQIQLSKRKLSLLFDSQKEFSLIYASLLGWQEKDAKLTLMRSSFKKIKAAPDVVSLANLKLVSGMRKNTFHDEYFQIDLLT